MCLLVTIALFNSNFLLHMQNDTLHITLQAFDSLSVARIFNMISVLARDMRVLDISESLSNHFYHNFICSKCFCNKKFVIIIFFVFLLKCLVIISRFSVLDLYISSLLISFLSLLMTLSLFAFCTFSICF